MSNEIILTLRKEPDTVQCTERNAEISELKTAAMQDMNVNGAVEEKDQLRKSVRHVQEELIEIERLLAHWNKSHLSRSSVDNPIKSTDEPGRKSHSVGTSCFITSLPLPHSNRIDTSPKSNLCPSPSASKKVHVSTQVVSRRTHAEVRDGHSEAPHGDERQRRRHSEQVTQEFKRTRTSSECARHATPPRGSTRSCASERHGRPPS